MKLWQKRKKSQTPQPGIEPGTPANAADALPLSHRDTVCWGPGFDSRLGRLRFFPFLPKLHFQLFSPPPFLSSFFLFLFLSFPLPFPSTFRLRFKISLFALIPLITILSGRARCTMATVTGSPSEAGLVCGHWIMPML